MTVRRSAALGLWSLLFLPVTLWAQAATGNIAGIVRDASGAVLPGVTVEAASPALIERVRTVVTDEAGAYRIIELRPGTYTVTFSLGGFTTVKREGIELTTSFTAAVNAEMRVGAVEETITVTGESPVVDISSARQQTTVSRDVLDAIPTTKRLGQYASFIPGATYANPTFQDSGGTAGEGGQFGVHGQRAADAIVNMEGMNQNMFGLDVYSYNSQTIQEVVVETGATSAEAMTGGVQLNIDSFFGPGDPRTGNFAPDCDLANPNGSGECGPWSDRSFGQRRAGTRFADDAIAGVNKQQYNWQSSVSLQQELRPGMALNVGYFLTRFGNFLVTDNLAVGPEDFDRFCLTLPATDSRLPGAGEQRCGFFDVKPSLFGRVDNVRLRRQHGARLAMARPVRDPGWTPCADQRPVRVLAA
jgi:hypothetical protein